MSTVGFEVYNDLNQLVISSSFPVMNMSQVGVANCVMIDPYNSEGRVMYPGGAIRYDFPIVALKPLTLNLFPRLGGVTANPSDWNDRRFVGLRFLAQNWNFAPVIGQVQAYLFEAFAIDSGGKFGMQSFDESGRLLFDSESVAMRVVKVGKPADATYDGYQDHGSGVGFGGYRTLFYSVPWPNDAEAYVEVSGGTYTSGGEGSGGVWGFVGNFKRLTLAYTYMKDYGLGGYTPGSVMFVKRT